MAKLSHDEVGALKALVDPTRLRILGSLAGQARSESALAAELGLTSSVVHRHVERLRTAGLVTRANPAGLVSRANPADRVVRLEPAALQGLGRALAAVEARVDGGGSSFTGPDGEPLPADEARVLRGFVDDGRLTTIPAHEQKRLVVLRFLRDQCFPEDRDYPEKEVNQRLAVWHPDAAALRRYLVDGRLMTREAGVYRRSISD